MCKFDKLFFPYSDGNEREEEEEDNADSLLVRFALGQTKLRIPPGAVGVVGSATAKQSTRSADSSKRRKWALAAELETEFREALRETSPAATPLKRSRSVSYGHRWARV